MRVTFTYRRLREDPADPTIYEALRDKLKREPSPGDLATEIRRILREGAERAGAARDARAAAASGAPARVSK